MHVKCTSHSVYEAFPSGSVFVLRTARWHIINPQIWQSFEKLQNDIQFASSNKNDTASSNTSDDEIKLRLQKLKKLLDDGLISERTFKLLEKGFST